MRRDCFRRADHRIRLHLRTGRYGDRPGPYTPCLKKRVLINNNINKMPECLSPGRFSLAPDQLEIPQIDEQATGLTRDKDGIKAVDGVAKQGGPAQDAEIPKSNGNDAAALFLALQPLHEKSHGKEGLTRKSHDQPNFIRAQTLSSRKRIRNPPAGNRPGDSELINEGFYSIIARPASQSDRFLQGDPSARPFPGRASKRPAETSDGAMKRLIVNADDFGWSEAVNEGILKAHLEGIVTSATLMTNLPDALGALELARLRAPGLGIGLHLNLTEGKPLSPLSRVAPIVDEEGKFCRGLGTLFVKASVRREVRKAIRSELEAQAAWAADHRCKPSHVDSHKHVHLHPAILQSAVDVASRHGIRAMRRTCETTLPGAGPLLPQEWDSGRRFIQRLQAGLARVGACFALRPLKRSNLLSTDWFFGIRATGGLTPRLILKLLECAPAGTGELMVHVGLAGDPSPRPTRLFRSRPAELRALTHEEVKAGVFARGWRLISYKELCSEPRS